MEHEIQFKVIKSNKDNKRIIFLREKESIFEATTDQNIISEFGGEPFKSGRVGIVDKKIVIEPDYPLVKKEMLFKTLEKKFYYIWPDK